MGRPYVAVRPSRISSSSILRRPEEDAVHPLADRGGHLAVAEVGRERRGRSPPSRARSPAPPAARPSPAGTVVVAPERSASRRSAAPPCAATIRRCERRPRRDAPAGRARSCRTRGLPSRTATRRIRSSRLISPAPQQTWRTAARIRSDDRLLRGSSPRSPLRSPRRRGARPRSGRAGPRRARSRPPHPRRAPPRSAPARRAWRGRGSSAAAARSALRRRHPRARSRRRRRTAPRPAHDLPLLGERRHRHRHRCKPRDVDVRLVDCSRCAPCAPSCAPRAS